MSFQVSLSGSRAPGRRRAAVVSPDWPLLVVAAALLGLGLVMIASASLSIAERQTGEPFYYLYRQAATVGVGLLAALLVARIPLKLWERSGGLWIVLCLVLLAALFIPGLGRTVNGSTRWLALGPVNFQVSELVKLAVVVYVAGYLVRHGETVRSTIGGFLKPMALVASLAVLLLAEPDFGAAVVLTATAMGMMFLGGVRLWLFGVLVFLALGLLGILAVSSPYRMERLTAFLNPWADPFNTGFQLTQALIAFGRGEWFGVGLGGSVQKLFYLPEAHTDFLFAVLAEELGLAGVIVVVSLFSFLVWRAFRIGRDAATQQNLFGSHLAYGIGLWMALQAFINMGVNTGLLPTKGLTLPLMSYGRSSIVVTCVAVALLLRIDYETRSGIVSARRVRQ